LDEPTAALDIHHKSDVFDLLWSLSRKGIAVVVVTHDLNAASRFCDALALLKDGRLIETGPPGRVIREDLLSEAYQTSLRVVEHPLTSAPMVLVLGKRAHEKTQTGA
jgi:iron complex transport system ATP-binding protein